MIMMLKQISGTHPLILIKQGNKIGDEGARALSTPLTSSSSLAYLDLDVNFILYYYIYNFIYNDYNDNDNDNDNDDMEKISGTHRHHLFKQGNEKIGSNTWREIGTAIAPDYIVKNGIGGGKYITR